MSGALEVTTSVLDEQARKMFADVESPVREHLRSAVMAAGDRVAALAAQNAPRLTGDLAASIHAHYFESLDSLGTFVKADEFYGFFQEHGVVNRGTKNNKRQGRGTVQRMHRMFLAEAGEWRVPPHPFLRPAANDLRDEIIASLQEAVADGVEEVSA